jgi:hypothetical protein
MKITPFAAKLSMASHMNELLFLLFHPLWQRGQGDFQCDHFKPEILMTADDRSRTPNPDR